MKYLLVTICVLSILSGCAQFHKAQRAEWYEWEAGRMILNEKMPMKHPCAVRTRRLAVEMKLRGEHFWQAWGTYDGKPHTWIIDKHGRYVDAAQWDTSVEHYRINRTVEYGKH